MVSLIQRCVCVCVCDLGGMQGDIQQLLIVDDPGAAETYCQDYIPDCDAPLPYNSILTEPEEVRREGKGRDGGHR